MHNNFVTTASALREVLSWVDNSHLSPEAMQTLDNLHEMVSKVDPELENGQKSMMLCDLFSYKNYTIWAGKEDVEFLMDSDEIQDVLPNIPEADRDALVEEVVNRVNWRGEAFDDCSAGNDIISEAMNDVFNGYMEQLPFVFDEAPFLDVPEDHNFYGELRPTSFLMGKLEEEGLTPLAASLLRTDPPPRFLASYNLRLNEVSVYGEYHLGSDPKAMPEQAKVPLTKEESASLINAFERMCRSWNTGKDCLTVLNEKRAGAGLDPIKKPLSAVIQSAQNNAPSAAPQQKDNAISR